MAETWSGDVFCRIINGEADCVAVGQDDDFLVFLDKSPVRKGHALIVPKQHFPTLLELPPSLHAGLLGWGQRLAAAAVSELGADGSFVALNNVVSQSVPHVHLHVIPRRKGDGLRGFFWPRTRYAEGEAAEYAVRLARGLG